MKMVFIDWLTVDKLIQALCWTLLHSLWQGLLLAIIAAFIIILTRRSAARYRYNILTVLFIVFIIVTGVNFMRQVIVTKPDRPESISFSSVSPTGNGLALPDETGVGPTTVSLSYFDKIVQYFNDHAYFVVTIWFILFSIQLVRILSNLGYVRHIRRYKTTEPAIYWQHKVKELAQSLHLQTPFLLLESAVIKVPVVIGWLKPVILMPLGLLNNLRQEEVEAILLHELAHIRRKDYLINLLQSFAEIVFFFNPAILWISSLMREERENCCDDMAISRVKSKKQFVHALVAFQEYVMESTNPKTALGFASRKNQLLNRVKRIIYNENKKLNAMEKGFFVLSIAVIGLLGFVSKDRLPAKKVNLTTYVTPVVKALDINTATRYLPPVDTVPEPPEFKNLSSSVNKDDNGETKTITATDQNGKKYKIIRRLDGKPELYINDKKIPGDVMDSYKKLITAMEQAVESRNKKTLEKVEKDQAEQSAQVLKLEAERMLLMAKLKGLDDEKAKFDYESMTKLNEFKWEAKKMQLYNDKLKLKEEHSKEMMLNKEKLLQEKLLAQKLHASLDQVEREKLLNEKLQRLEHDQKLQMEKKFLYREQVLNEKMQLLKGEKEPQLQQRSYYFLIDPIIADMVKEKLVPRAEEDISFELSEKRFIVNGTKQSSGMHEIFKKKYLKKEGDYFRFSRKNGNASTTIHLN